MEMRSVVDQLQGLRKVTERVPGAVLDWQKGDVAVAKRGAREIAYAAGGYDLWVNGHLKRPDLTLQEAVMALREGGN